jgi:hypothetical protein
VTFSGTTNAAAANYENIEIDLQCTTQGTTPLMVQARYGAMWLNNGNTRERVLRARAHTLIAYRTRSTEHIS